MRSTPSWSFLAANIQSVTTHSGQEQPLLLLWLQPSIRGELKPAVPWLMRRDFYDTVRGVDTLHLGVHRFRSDRSKVLEAAVSAKDDFEVCSSEVSA